MPDPDIRVRAGLDHDPDDPALVYTDLPVHYGEGGGAVEVTIGRQDESQEIRPTEMRWAVRNADNRFTPNNPASPLYGKWEQGRRVQVAECLDGDEFILGTGFLQIPSMEVVDPRSSQPVTVSAVDRMGRLEAAPAYLGNLTEYIRHTGGGTLVEHIPLTDPDLPAMSLITSSVGQVVLTRANVDTRAFGAQDLLAPSSMDGPLADDARYLAWTPAFAEFSGFSVPILTSMAVLTFPAQVPITGSPTVIAWSLWVYKVPPDQRLIDDGTWWWGGNLAGLSTSAGYVQIIDGFPNVPVTPGTTIETAWAPDLTLPRPIATDAWRLVTVRVDTSTGHVDVWIGTDVVASTAGTPSAAPTRITNMVLGNELLGSIGQVQVRVGGAETMTREDHLAQQRFAYTGYHRQTVAERIITLAGWAGVPASEVDIPAAASTPMQAMRLAGRTPAEVIRAAATTGQDTPITTGAGQITLIPRSDRYDQQVAMQIPWGWIGYRAIRYRPDAPVTDVTVSRTGGGTARRSDAALARRYGTRGVQFELDTAVDADAANLAAWTLDALSKMRVRCPSIRINMLDQTIAERTALLRLRVGDRIQLTGLPPGSPEDVPHLIIQGIKHTIGPGRRRVIEFNTSPLLGRAVGMPPPGARVGSAVVGDQTVIAY